MAKGLLHIITDPIGGDIFVNGEYRGTKDVNIELEQGAYNITFGNVAGYTTPLPLSVIVNQNMTALVTVEYTRYVIDVGMFPQSMEENIDAQNVK